MIHGEDKVDRPTIAAYFAAKQAQQALNHITKADCWAEKPNFFSLAGSLRCFITKNDFSKCKQLEEQLDLEYVRTSLNYSFSHMWKPFPHLTLDDMCPGYKGRHFCKQHRYRKPQPWCLVEYGLADMTGYVIAGVPRFPPWAEKTPSWKSHKEQWRLHHEDPETTPQPGPYKAIHGKKPKSSFNLILALKLLFSYLPVKNGCIPDSVEEINQCNYEFFDVTCDREFGTVAILEFFQKLRGLGYTMGFGNDRLNSVFTFYLIPKLQEAPDMKYLAIANQKCLALSFRSTVICHFISNMFFNQHVITTKEAKLPLIVQHFRKYMRPIDSHDQRANYLQYPFKASKAHQRFFDAWNRSAQVNTELIFNFGRTTISSRRCLEYRAIALSASYRNTRDLMDMKSFSMQVKLPNQHYAHRHHCIHRPENNKIKCACCNKSVAHYFCLQCQVYLHRSNLPSVTGKYKFRTPGCWWQFKGISFILPLSTSSPLLSNPVPLLFRSSLTHS